MDNLKQAQAIVWLAKNKDLAKKFAYHFKSQGKPNSHPVSNMTANQYGDEAWQLFEALEAIIK
jgi:hypothetical protein